MFKIKFFGVSACLMLGLACGDDAKKPTDVLSVGPSGGSFALDDSTRLEVPAGAVDKTVELSFERGQDPGLTGAVPGTLMRLGPAGVKFHKAIRLTVTYPKGKLPREDVTWLRMVQVVANGKAGSTQLLSHDTTNGTLTAAIVETGSYALADLELAHATVTTEQAPIKDVDVLFVVDNSESMAPEQANLAANFPRFIKALDQAGLNYHVGVVSTDLGVGMHGFDSCAQQGGDGGKLWGTPADGHCNGPADPWIANIEGATNVPGGDVAAAFSCIAQIGTGGCGFESTLEAARRALDPKLKVNPGFLRPDAALAVVFLTDEDDCSAQDMALFDPAQHDITALLGPLSSFRCFEFGVQCDINDRTQVGPRKDCVPGHPSGHQYLYKVSDYESFFKALKPPGRLMLAAIAGPAEPVEVALAEGDRPQLMHSCQTVQAQAVPAIRIKALMDAFGDLGHFNTGKDASGTEVPVNICKDDYSPALSHIGGLVTTKILTSWCLPFDPVDTNPLTPELDADCVVVGAQTGAIPACTATSTEPCFRVESVETATCTTSSAALRIENTTSPAELGKTIHAVCLKL